jgi:hypothetical protein
MMEQLYPKPKRRRPYTRMDRQGPRAAYILEKERRIRQETERVQAELARMDVEADQPFVCPDCGQRFGHRGSVTNHRRLRCKATRAACSA